MHRLFIALRPPAPVRQQLTALMGGVPGARWQDDRQLHVTLRFIGEVDRHRADDLAAVLAGLRHPPVEIRVEGVGLFDRRGRVDSLWAGIAPRDALLPLHRKLDGLCARAGLTRESRAFLPHVTLARFSRGGGDPADFVGRNGALSGPPFRVDHIGLYESHLGHGGAAYQLVDRYPLVG